MAFLFVNLIVPLLITAAIVIGISILAIKLWFFVMKLSIVFSRLALSLLISGLSGMSILENKFLNFILCAAIIYGIIYVFSLLDRVDLALGFGCTLFISGLATILTVFLCTSFISTAVESDLIAINLWWVQMLCGIITFAITAFMWFSDVERVKEEKNKPSFIPNKLSIRVGRIGASLIYGFSLLIFVNMFFSSIIINTNVVQILIFLILIGASYIADLFLLDRAS